MEWLLGKGIEVSEVNAAFDDLNLHGEICHRKPLLSAIGEVQDRMADFKERVRTFYFEVVLSPHQCLDCGGRLKTAGQSLCSCSCGKTLGSTLEFQRSACCGMRLVRRAFDYACLKCQEVVPRQTGLEFPLRTEA